jgi:hypothetical protein
MNEVISFILNIDGQELRSAGIRETFCSLDTVAGV